MRRCMTDFPDVNVHVNELSSARIWQHKLCATYSANVNINNCLPIKIYYRICTLRHIKIEINGSNDKVNNKNYHTVWTVPNRRYRLKIETITHIYVLVLVHALPKLVLWVQTSHLSLRYVSSIAATFFRQVYQKIYSLWHMNRKQLQFIARD